MQKYANLVDLEKMLSNAYFLAKIRFDTAENEPAKNLQTFANFPNFASPNSSGRTAESLLMYAGAARGVGGLGGVPRRRRGRRAVGGGRGATLWRPLGES